MVRRVLAAVVLAGAPVLAHAQSASAPLCAKRSATPRVQRPIAPIATRRSEVRDAVLIIDF